MTTNASKHAVGATLKQSVYPVSFPSHRLSEAEMNLNSIDKERYAFLIAIREWNKTLRGYGFIFRTDHEPTVYVI